MGSQYTNEFLWSYPQGGGRWYTEWLAEREAAAALVMALPKCAGTWLRGSGGHREHAHDCLLPATWDVGSSGPYCDEHHHDGHGEQEADYAPALRAMLSIMQSWVSS